MERFVFEREVDGNAHLFCLTEHEMFAVYDMVQHYHDMEDVKNWMDCSDRLNDFTEDEIDDIAYLKRDIENNDVSWWTACELAVFKYEQGKKDGGVIL